MNTGCAQSLHHQWGALFGVALHASDEVARPFGGVVATDRDARTTAGVGQCAPAMPDVGCVQQTITVVVFGALNKKAC
jgi:hypothetical protein